MDDREFLEQVKRTTAEIRRRSDDQCKDIMLDIYRSSFSALRDFIVGFNHDTEQFLVEVSKLVDNVELAEQAYWPATTESDDDAS